MTAALTLLGVVTLVHVAAYALGCFVGWIEGFYEEVDE